MPDFVTGDRELARLLNTLPNRAAQELQGTLIGILQETKREVIRSSTFKHITREQLNGIIRVHPRPRAAQADRVKVSRISDVTGEIFSLWRGADSTDDQRGAAARIEKTVGGGIIRPTGGRRYLAIPLGDLRTEPGRVRGVGFGEPVVQMGTGRTRRRVRQTRIADLEGTFLLKKRGPNRIVMQMLAAGRAGIGEREASKERSKRGLAGTIKGIRAKQLGERSRLVGVLVPRARQATPLDFFGSWDRLASKRTARFGRMLDRLTKEGIR